jgi:general secretion pathway protein B
MSYILDALRKSDQQRHRGAAPKLLAAVLLGAGVAIGWLRPWQAEQATPAATQSEASGHQSVPVRPEIAPTPAPALAPAPVIAPALAPVRAPAAVPVPAPASVKSQSPARVGTEAPGKPQNDAAAESSRATAVPQQPPGTAAADSAPAQNVISMAELPLALQQELTPMTISFHAYSANPRDRLVGINNRMLREGDDVAPGLKLEQITPEGMIFGYKGYSFRRGVK